MPTEKKSEINYAFKMLYVLAIFMIVDGHIGSMDYLNLNGLLPYQNYHVALFAFASGYFLHLNYGAKAFVWRKFSHLIIPLYLWNVFYGVLCFYLNRYQGFAIGGELNAYNLLIAPLTDGHQYIYNMGSWFLVPLFGVELIGYFLLKPFAEQRYLNTAAIVFFVLALALGMLGLEASVTRYGERNFYLTLYRILFFLPCFALGFLYKRILEKYDRIPTALYLFLLLTGMVVIFARYPHIGINPAWLDFSDVPVVIIYLIVFIPILFWVKISHILETVIKNSPTLCYIADHTFDIMMHQFLGLMLAKKLLSGFGTFNPTAFKTDIWYYHFPWGEALVTPFYLTITLVISLLTGFTSRKLCLIIRKDVSANRPREKMMKVAESGRSMIEMLGVLAIVGILSIGGITGYSKALRKVKNNQLITQMSQLVMNIRALYFTQKSFEGISEQTLINTGTVPGDMLSENSADDIIKHIYNGNVYVFQSLDATGKYGAFEVYAVGLNQDACVVLATMDWGQDPSSGFEGMYIGAADEITEPMLKDIHSPADSAPENGIFTAGMHDDAVPLGVTTALSVCSCAGNTCVIGLKYI